MGDGLSGDGWAAACRVNRPARDKSGPRAIRKNDCGGRVNARKITASPAHVSLGKISAVCRVNIWLAVVVLDDELIREFGGYRSVARHR